MSWVDDKNDSVSIFSVGINSKSFPSPVHSVQGTYLPTNFLRRRTRIDGTADNAEVSQSQAASDERLLSHVTLGRVECSKQTASAHSRALRAECCILGIPRTQYSDLVFGIVLYFHVF